MTSSSLSPRGAMPAQKALALYEYRVPVFCLVFSVLSLDNLFTCFESRAPWLENNTQSQKE